MSKRIQRFNLGDKVVVSNDISGTNAKGFLDWLRERDTVMEVVSVEDDDGLTIYNCIDVVTNRLIYGVDGEEFPFVDADLEKYNEYPKNSMMMVYKNVFVAPEMIKEYKLTNDQVIKVNERVVELLSFVVSCKPIPIDMNKETLVESISSIIFGKLLNNNNPDIVKPIPTIDEMSISRPADIFTSILGAIASVTMSEDTKEDNTDDKDGCDCGLCMIMNDLKEVYKAKVDTDTPKEEEVSESLNDLVDRLMVPDIEAKRLAMIYDIYPIEMPDIMTYIRDVTVEDSKGVELGISVYKTKNILDSLFNITIDGKAIMYTDIGKDITDNTLLGRMVMTKVLNDKEIKFNDDFKYIIPDLDIDSITVGDIKTNLDDKYIFVVRSYYKNER